MWLEFDKKLYNISYAKRIYLENCMIFFDVIPDSCSFYIEFNNKEKAKKEYNKLIKNLKKTKIQ